MDFFWMLYWVKRPDWPVTTCMMGAGITISSMVSYDCRGFQPLGGITCEKRRRDGENVSERMRVKEGTEQERGGGRESEKHVAKVGGATVTLHG